MHLDQCFSQSSAAAGLVSGYKEQPGLAECEMQIQQLKVCSDFGDCSPSPVRRFGDENTEVVVNLTRPQVVSGCRNVSKPLRATGRTSLAVDEQEDTWRKLAPKRKLQKLGTIRARHDEQKWMEIIRKARMAANDSQWTEGVRNARSIDDLARV